MTDLTTPPRDHSVYRALAADGTVLYVGVTKGLSRRRAYHSSTSKWRLEDLFPAIPRCPIHSCQLDTFDDGSPAECCYCQSDLLDENEAS